MVYQLLSVSLLLLGSCAAWADQAPAQSAGTATSSTMPDNAQALRPTYVLQTGDQIVIRSLNVEEIADRPFRVEPDGTVTLPQIGQVRVSGLTIEAAEAELKTRYSRFVIDPQIVILVASFQNPPVFVVGSFKAPGVYPLQGKRTIVELLTQIGGIAPNASRRIRLTRKFEQGQIPLPNAVPSTDGKSTYVDLEVSALQTGAAAAEDLVLEPFDILSVERAEMIFVMGAVGRVGGIELGERKQLSMLQALAMAGGLAPNAKATKAFILRPVAESAQRAPIAVDLKSIQAGNANDFPLHSNDVLFVPTSRSAAVWNRLGVIGTGLATASLWIIFR